MDRRILGPGIYGSVRRPDLTETDQDFLAETDQETNQDFWHGFIFVRVLYPELFDPKVLRCLRASHELNSLRMFLRYFLNNRQK